MLFPPKFDSFYKNVAFARLTVYVNRHFFTKILLCVCAVEIAQSSISRHICPNVSQEIGEGTDCFDLTGIWGGLLDLTASVLT